MVIWLLEKVFLLTIAFAIYSKNVLKLGRNRSVLSNKCKCLRYTWASFI